MGKILIEVPEEIHDKLRHHKIRTKQDMQDLVNNILSEYFHQKELDDMKFS